MTAQIPTVAKLQLPALAARVSPAQAVLDECLSRQNGKHPVERLFDALNSKDEAVSYKAAADLLPYLIPKKRASEERVAVDLPRARTIDELNQQIEAVTHLIASGQIPMEQASMLLRALNLRADALGYLEQRKTREAMAALKQELQEMGASAHTAPYEVSILG